MSNEKGRRHFAPEEKVNALKRRLRDHEPVSKICEDLRIQPSQFHQWEREFFERGSMVFEKSGRKNGRVESALERRNAELEAKLQRKNEVLGELMEEHRQAKKSLGET